MTTPTTTSWTRWLFSIEPGGRRRSNVEMRVNAVRIGRTLFGADALIKITTYADRSFTMQILSDACPVEDPSYVESMTRQLRAWATSGWGPGTRVQCVLAKQESGRRIGSLADGLIVGTHGNTSDPGQLR